MNTSEISELLKETLLFSALNEDELRGLAKLAKEQYFTS